MATITFKKDENVPAGQDDVYKSSTVSVPSGEPAGSQSRPAPRKKPGLVRPITQGKLLRPGGPSKPRPAMKPIVSRNTQAAVLPGAGAGAARSSASASAAPAVAKTPAAAKRTSTAAAGAPPPRPPPPPAAPAAAPEKPMYKALYDFATSNEGEMALVKDEQVEVTQKEESGGWWLVKKNGVEGWAPSTYLELVPPKPKPVAAAPTPAPAKRAPPPAPGAGKPTSANATSTPIASRFTANGNGSSVPAPATKPKPASSSAQTTMRHDKPTAMTADAGAAPVAVMPGMGVQGGFAELLAKKKAERAAAEGSGSSTPPPPIAPKPAGGAGAANGKPPPPPRR